MLGSDVWRIEEERGRHNIHSMECHSHDSRNNRQHLQPIPPCLPKADDSLWFSSLTAVCGTIIATDRRVGSTSGVSHGVGSWFSDWEQRSLPSSACWDSHSTANLPGSKHQGFSSLNDLKAQDLTSGWEEDYGTSLGEAGLGVGGDADCWWGSGAFIYLPLFCICFGEDVIKIKCLGIWELSGVTPCHRRF